MLPSHAVFWQVDLFIHSCNPPLLDLYAWGCPSQGLSPHRSYSLMGRHRLAKLKGIQSLRANKDKSCRREIGLEWTVRQDLSGWWVSVTAGVIHKRAGETTERTHSTEKMGDVVHNSVSHGEKCFLLHISISESSRSEDSDNRALGTV